MKRIMLFGVCLVVVGGFFAAPVQAQEDRFEFNLGANVPLVSRTFEMDQELGYYTRFGVVINDRMTLGLVYDTRSGSDDLGTGYDVDVDLYGVSAVWTLSGDPGFQLVGITSIGVGQVSWSNEDPPVPGFRDEVDIDFWYEFGGGAQFRFKERFTVRCLATVRGMRPKDPSQIIASSRTELVPSVSLGIRF